ncbi:MAG: aquaporin [Muribaculaceae bacterium]|nr:aquaporin [Muribaculaceae bacterium]
MNIQKYFAEGIGTMFLVLLACGSAVLAGPSIGVLGIGLCFGLVLLCLCYAIGNISGCHVNPAVSFAMFISGRMELKDFVWYVIAQLIGATVGAWFLWLLVEFSSDGFPYNFGGITYLINDTIGVAAPADAVAGGMATLPDGTRAAVTEVQYAANVLQPGATVWMALISEIVLTFLFVFVVLGSTDSKKGYGKFAGLAIGLALGLVNIVGIPVDNCSVNPARSFGPAIFNPNTLTWCNFWIMVVGPCVGAMLAAYCWRICNFGKQSAELDSDQFDV